MGLDLALGAVVLLAAIRGWARGFLLQAVRLAAMVGSVFAAGPIRDVARPYAREHIPTMAPDVLDKLLWWTAAVVTAVVASGVASAIVRGAKNRGDRESGGGDADRGAGLLMGAAKGLIVASFLAAGIDRYSAKYLGEVPWAREQIEKSRGMQFSQTYRPAMRLWESAPVRRFVAHVRQAGLSTPEPAGGATESADSRLLHAPAPSAAIPPALSLPGPLPLDPASPDFLRDLDKAFGQDETPKSR